MSTDEKNYETIVNKINEFLHKHMLRKTEKSELVNEKLWNIIDCHNKSKPKGQRSKTGRIPRELIGKPFAYKIDDDRFLAFMVTKTEGVTRADIYYKIKTPKGTVYINFPNVYETDKPPILCYTAHFFDRYVERITDVKVRDRKSAIKHFAKQYLLQPAIGFKMYDTFAGSLSGKFNNGLGLGKNFGNIILFTTFIDNSLLRKDQQDDIEYINGLVKKQLDFYRE